MYTRRRFLEISALGTAGAAVSTIPGCVETNQPLVEIFPSSTFFTRRANALTVNFCGILSPQVERARYRLTNGAWNKVPQGLPRVPKPLFTIELSAHDLLEGSNTLTIEATSQQGRTKVFEKEFIYDPSPIELPLTVSWSNNKNLDVQDGYWETFEQEQEWRIRPKPGFEEYDRIVNVTGAFSGGRRVETDVVFRDPGWLGWRGKRAYGFGVLTLWGGHLEKTAIRPRRGWSFGIAWFFAPRRSPEQEEEPGLILGCGHKQGRERSKRVFEHAPLIPQKDTQYSVIAEAFPVLGLDGKFLYWRQRLKWWKAGTPEPKQWMVMDDNKQGGSLLPEAEYAVSLLAHRTQVEFGTVTVKPLESTVMDS